VTHPASYPIGAGSYFAG